MALKELSITLGILAGTAGVTNSGYGLYQNFIIKPAQNVEYNINLMNETPLFAEAVEIQPIKDIAMRVEVTVKVYKSGDILIESGNRRQFIPFKLTETRSALDFLVPSAYAGETQLIDGIEYELQILRYTETVTQLDKQKIQRVRTYINGEMETSIIDIRSNSVIDTRESKKTLSETERKAIEASPYKKKVYTPKK